jgi:hypothetical protein
MERNILQAFVIIPGYPTNAICGRATSWWMFEEFNESTCPHSGI